MNAVRDTKFDCRIRCNILFASKGVKNPAGSMPLEVYKSVNILQSFLWWIEMLARPVDDSLIGNAMQRGRFLRREICRPKK
ncbi:hypothetical protein CI1B_27700 [Bradyrhizobium ivorense]|uniref:Uncharacterized protein n=1 Tax=Bradyrhizobium ivorense TaxID=2511166 RepID=A0A508T6Y1_9BRAD|nr:hypothetical protein CI1B_27700 [Bradyrhizobium ivorense]VIO71310.1 hypothetical protein CI41S_29810 [Bradyrhizobium ivorense]